MTAQVVAPCATCETSSAATLGASVLLESPSKKPRVGLVDNSSAPGPGGEMHGEESTRLPNACFTDVERQDGDDDDDDDGILAGASCKENDDGKIHTAQPAQKDAPGSKKMPLVVSTENRDNSNNSNNNNNNNPPTVDFSSTHAAAIRTLAKTPARSGLRKSVVSANAQQPPQTTTATKGTEDGHIYWHGTREDDKPDDSTNASAQPSRPRRKAALNGETRRRTGRDAEDAPTDARCEIAHYVADDVDRMPADGLDAPIQNAKVDRGNTTAAAESSSAPTPAPIVSGQVLCDHCGDRLIVGLDVVASCVMCNNTEIPFDVCEICYNQLVEAQRAAAAATTAAAAYDSQQKATSSKDKGTRKRTRKPPKPRRAAPFHACDAAQFQTHYVDPCPDCGQPLLSRRDDNELVFTCTCSD